MSVFITALIFLVMVWEAVKLAISWKQQASVWAGTKYARAEQPRIFWSLFSLHSGLFLLIMAVISSLLFGWLE